MEEKNTSLLIIENNKLAEFKEKFLPKFSDYMKRTGKIVGLGSLAFLGFGAFAIGSAPIATIGATLAVATGFRTVQNIIYKTEPSLMFISRSKHGENQIFQDVRLNLASKMKEYTAIEKGGMMALQTLVGFSRYKENLKFSDFENGENGEKIYCQKFSTVTHGINIKTLQMIEKLGYIKIDSIDEKFRHSTVDEILKKDPKGMKKLLIAEKLGFKNYKDLKKIFKAQIVGDKKTLESMKKSFSKVTFRLTDKKIDFKELYEKANNLDEITDPKERTALKRLAVIFDNNQGILATKKIDISKDKFGRDIIVYDQKESFGRKVEKENNKNRTVISSNFRESIRNPILKENEEVDFSKKETDKKIESQINIYER